MRSLMLLFLFCGTFFIACGGTTGSTSKRNYSRDIIFTEEIQLAQAHNAYDLIYKLRPQWLRSRGIKSINFPEASQPVVYVNRAEYGSINSLNNIPISNIAEVRYFNASDATTKYGSNHTGGVIEITTF